jgi:hypothetical protein
MGGALLSLAVGAGIGLLIHRPGVTPAVFVPVEDVSRTGSVAQTATRVMPDEPIHGLEPTPLWPAQVPFLDGGTRSAPQKRAAVAPTLPDIVVEIPALPEVALVFVQPEPRVEPDATDPAYVDPRAQVRILETIVVEAAATQPARPGPAAVAGRPERAAADQRRREAAPQPFVLPSALASR